LKKNTSSATGLGSVLVSALPWSNEHPDSNNYRGDHIVHAVLGFVGKVIDRAEHDGEEHAQQHAPAGVKGHLSTTF
jgi:hypothetical protein